MKSTREQCDGHICPKTMLIFDLRNLDDGWIVIKVGRQETGQISAEVCAEMWSVDRGAPRWSPSKELLQLGRRQQDHLHVLFQAALEEGAEVTGPCLVS